MRIAVFGASGRTGQRVVKQAVSRGFEVRAVSRNPPESDTSSVEWVEADIRDPERVREALSGVDAVISSVGDGVRREETNVYSEGINCLINEMSKGGPLRLAVVSAAPLGARNEVSFFKRTLYRGLWFAFGATYRDMERMEYQISQCKHLEWICLRPPFLRDRPTTGAYYTSAVKGVGYSITTGDLAEALLDSVVQNQLLGKITYIASSRGKRELNFRSPRR